MNFRAILGILASVGALGCKAVAPEFGSSIPAARQNADELFYSVSSRFTNIQRTPKLLRARQQFGHYALVPSGVYNDTSVWMSYGADSSRIFADDGYPTATQYIVVPHSSTEPPRNLAESREVVRLRRLSDNEYEWYTNVDVGVGHVGAADLLEVLAAALRAGERQQSNGIRADYRANFPRTTAALGRLYSLDTLRTTLDAEGATTFDLAIHLTPDSLAKVMPAYAEYIDKYVRKGRYHIVVRDKSAGGARWFDAWAGDYWIHIKVRSKDGHFAPLDGAVRPMPDNLFIDASMQMKILLFTVGFQHMIGEFNIVKTPHERAYSVRFGAEPEWILPPTVHYFLKSPLARPFQGKGVPIYISLRDTPGAQTILNRRAMLVVQESAILRFINKLSGTAVGDFLGASEKEANRFNADTFRALRADITALLQ